MSFYNQKSLKSNEGNTAIRYAVLLGMLKPFVIFEVSLWVPAKINRNPRITLRLLLPKAGTREYQLLSKTAYVI